MILGSREKAPALAPEIVIRSYSAMDDRGAIPGICGRSFAEPPWPGDWDEFPEFDPKGVFVAQDVQRRQAVGYVISFGRRDHGYVSVLAVLPECCRRGIGSALVQTAIDYLRAQGLRKIVVHAPESARWASYGSSYNDEKRPEWKEKLSLN